MQMCPLDRLEDQRCIKFPPPARRHWRQRKTWQTASISAAAVQVGARLRMLIAVLDAWQMVSISGCRRPVVDDGILAAEEEPGPSCQGTFPAIWSDLNTAARWLQCHWWTRPRIRLFSCRSTDFFEIKRRAADETDAPTDYSGHRNLRTAASFAHCFRLIHYSR